MTDQNKYNKALQLARSYYGKGCNEFLDTIFPELKESEDERIINQLISLVRSAGEVVPIPANQEELIAYLEKQKEQKPKQSEDEKEYVRTLKSLISDFLRGKDEIDRGYYQKIYDWLDGRHIEQKPADWDDELEKCKKNPLYFYDKYVKIKLKPAEWSEEDKRILDILIHALARIGANTRTDSTSINYAFVREIAWLKSLPERFNIQPKQEWSEEDERIRKAILGFLNPDKGGAYSSNAELVEWSDWLKSLRPQSHWKPSEEQMKCLEDCVKKAREL